MAWYNKKQEALDGEIQYLSSHISNTNRNMLTNNIVPFAFQNRAVRAAQKDDGSIWFCLGDCLKAMETTVDTSKAKAVLEENLGEGTTIDLPLQTAGGTQNALFVSESGVTFLLTRSRTDAGKALNKFIHCEVLPSIRKTGSISIAPKSALQLAKEQVKLHEELELAQEQIKILQEATERQAEVIDELFNYSSIVRIAKYNQISEKQFEWSRLKSASKMLGIEVKKAPCPRYGTKNLYSHDAWRMAYPSFQLPETTTLVIRAQVI